MKVVILAGGKGTRISEESHLKPKPMVDIGGKPILWHIMKIYNAYGLKEFIICVGYKGYVIKEYFANYFLHMSDVTFDMSDNKMVVHDNHCDPWKVTLIDTGTNTMTGGRLKRIEKYLNGDDFCFTYGDGVSNVNIEELIKFHKKRGKLATLTAVQTPGRYGSLNIEGDSINKFIEKPKGDGGWINGGFCVLSHKVLEYIDGDLTQWEKEPLENLANDGELVAYKHEGFWYAMDTLRDKNSLEDLWNSGKPPWKIWT